MTKPIKTAALERDHQGTSLGEFGVRAVGDLRTNLYRQWIACIAGGRIDVIKTRLVYHIGRYLMRYKIKASDTRGPSREELMAPPSRREIHDLRRNALSWFEADCELIIVLPFMQAGQLRLQKNYQRR